MPVVPIWSAACVASRRFGRVLSRFGEPVASRFSVLRVTIRSRPVDFGASRFGVLIVSVVPVVPVVPVASVDSVASRFGVLRVPIRSRFGVLIVPVASVVPIRSCRSCRSCRFGRAGRAGRVVSRRVAIWRAGRVEVKAQTQKKPDSSIGNRGSAIARRRALLTFS